MIQLAKEIIIAREYDYREYTILFDTENDLIDLILDELTFNNEYVYNYELHEIEALERVINTLSKQQLYYILEKMDFKIFQNETAFTNYFNYGKAAI